MKEKFSLKNGVVASKEMQTQDPRGSFKKEAAESQTMIGRFCWQESIVSGKPQLCSKDKFIELLSSPLVKAICEKINCLDPLMSSYANQKNALKKGLPIITPHACAYEGDGFRRNENAIPSGLAMLDIDSISDPKALYECVIAKRVKEEQIYFAAITPSGQGLRLIFELRPNESIQAGQERMVETCCIKEYDISTKDLARASYVMPMEYVLYMDDAMFDSSKIHGVDTESKLALLPQPPVGTRNNTYFSVATEVAKKIYRTMPEWGLTQGERQGACKRAATYAEKYAYWTPPYEPTIKTEESPFWGKSEGMTVPENMPKLFKILCGRVDDNFKPAMVCSMLPLLGLLATDCRFEYDNEEQSLSFLTIVAGPAASGKSFYKKAFDVVLTDVLESDDDEWANAQEFNEKKRLTKNSQEQPEDPHSSPRIQGANISEAALIQLLVNAKGKHVLIHSEELDSSLNNLSQRWGIKSDIYRKAFDNATHSVFTLNEQSTNANVPVYMNTLYAGTFNALKRFFPDAEDGTMTRFLFAKLPDMAFSSKPHWEKYSSKEQEEILRYCRLLENCGSAPIRCKAVEDAISKWLEYIRVNALKIDNRTVDRLSHRSAVIGYRAGMLAYLLEGRQNKKSCGDFAIWVASYCLATQMELFGNQMDAEYQQQKDFGVYNGNGSVILKREPLDLCKDKFTKAEYIEACKKFGKEGKPDSHRRYLDRLAQEGILVKLGGGLYQKKI